MSTLDLSSQLAFSASGIVAPPTPTVSAGAGPYSSPEEQAAAALVYISGASSITVEQFEASIPANLAAASALVDELSAATSVSAAEMGSLYTLLNPRKTLALTRD